MSDEPIEVISLEEQWPDSVGEPLTLIETDDPDAQAGSYVVQPGERVQTDGSTSHAGTELSVILSGTVLLGGPNLEAELSVGPNSFVAIPKGMEHYSRYETDEAAKLVYVILGEL